ncbi:MAG TPA: hypothetical protein VHX92_08510 [Rhizomicrobium sp.]|nr:hypothetical protein [Rhizomicrobium sp.]
MAQRDFNSIQNGWQVRHHLIGPKPEHAKTIAFEPGGTPHIMRHLSSFAVLTTIDLDHQPRGQANEIGKIWPKRKLAAEAQPIDLFAPQRLPESFLGIRRIGAKLA